MAHNDIHILSPRLIDRLSASTCLEQLDITNNPIVCDCHIQYLYTSNIWNRLDKRYSDEFVCYTINGWEYPLMKYAERANDCYEDNISSSFVTVTLIALVAVTIIATISVTLLVRRRSNAGASLYYKAIRRSESREMLPTSV